MDAGTRREGRGYGAPWWLYLLVALFALVVRIPFYWMLKSALAQQDDVFSSRRASHQAHAGILRPAGRAGADRPLLCQFVRLRHGNRALVTLIASFMAAYAIARIDAPGRNLLLLAPGHLDRSAGDRDDHPALSGATGPAPARLAVGPDGS